LLPIGAVCAQDFDSTSINWAYSAYFGTGWYQANSDREVFVLRTTPRWELREADISDDGKRKIGIELRFPVTLGLDRFDLGDIPGAIDTENLASVSFTPGIDITIPVNERWSLRPYATIGWGKVLNESGYSWTYWGGIKSRYAFQKGKLDWALVNAVSYVGYTPSEGRSDGIWPLMAALEFDYPVGNKQKTGEQLVLSWHGMYTTFENDLKIVLADSSTQPINDEWEIGMSLHKKDKRIRIWLVSFDRLGLAYRFSSSGGFKGISVVFRSVFDR
jgi:hypothetical protein